MSHLRSYKVLKRLDSVHQVVSGLAGLGYGICEHWNDSSACERFEDPELPQKQTLAISFTNDSLVVSNTAVVGPHRFEDPGSREMVHWNLGFQQLKDNPEDSIFWRRVREAIENVPVSVLKPDLLLLFGEAASNSNFQETVKLALENMDFWTSTRLGTRAAWSTLLSSSRCRWDCQSMAGKWVELPTVHYLRVWKTKIWWPRG